MIGSRAWFALMRRNVLYRKRNWVSSLFEMILPFCFVWILVALRNSIGSKNGTKPKTPTSTSSNITNSSIYNATSSWSADQVDVPEYIPNDFNALIPFSYHDYVTALQADRMCYKNRNKKLDISGIHNFGKNWQVPFVKCDYRLCQMKRQDAVPFCEYSFLAITGKNAEGLSRAMQLQQYMYNTWPILRPSSSTKLPFKFDFVQIFDSEQHIADYIERDDYGTNVPKMSMAIVFDGNSTTDYKYTLRQNSTNINSPASKIDGFPLSITSPPTNRLFHHYARTDFEACSRRVSDAKLGPLDDSCTGLYIYNGIIATQRLVGDFILHETGAASNGYSVSDGGVSYVQFPQQAFVVSGFFTTVQDTAPLLILLGLLYPVASMIGYIVQEKQLRQKELMKMMSVLESDIGWSWFLSFAMFNIVAAICAGVVSTALYVHSSTKLLCLFWILSLLATTVYCMTMATITSKTSRAVLIGLLVFFSGVFLTLTVDFDNGNPHIIAVLCLHPATAFSYGIKLLGRLEDLNFGLVDSTLHYGGARSQLSMMKIYQYLCIDIVLWGVLSWYLNRVITPDFGQALPFWFPFNINYWFPNKPTFKDENESYLNVMRDHLDRNIPTEPVCDSLLNQGKQGQSIEIKNLRKDYGNKVAVDGLNLSMYCGQITALLGHNGAGKTTTINMLTGATIPTSGTAMVAGKNICTDMSVIRQDIGICLQHDCLFPNLTAREHVQFFARLKGLYQKVSLEEAEHQVDQALIDVALSEKRDTFSKNLSGGMKRKLSVAIAFCGGSKVVVLDEPTSGMDPFSRRFTWNVIRHYKKDRIILLTTHFMDEADILGDRIAIMADGKLRCVGSSLFLKKTYGVGYQLTIDRGPEYLSSTSITPNENIEKYGSNSKAKLSHIVTDSVRDAVLLGNVGSELSYQLPMDAAASFPILFNELDEQVDKGNISCYGVSVTTLNEVFLMVARGDGPITSRSDSSTDSENDMESFESEVENNELPGGAQCFQSPVVDEVRLKRVETDRYFSRHVVALLKKRVMYFRRDRKAWICTTIVPSVFVFVGFLIVFLTASDLQMDPLLLSPNDYNSDIGLNQVNFNSPDNPFTCQPGICSHKEFFRNDTNTNETYVFCGYQAKLGISPEGFIATNQTCTITDSMNIMSTVESSTLQVSDTDVTNIEQASTTLRDISTSTQYAKYGAIWFSHFQDSVTNGKLYNETVIQLCSLAEARFNFTSDCSRFGGVGYTIQYNYTALHAALLFEQIANEALARHGSKNVNINVETTILPLPVTPIERSVGAGLNAFLAWFLVVVSFPFIGGAFGSFVVHEKSTRAKHLQTVAGVEPSAYWMSTYLWDTINYQIPLWTTIALMFLFHVDILTTTNRGVFQGIATILILFGPALAGFTYCISFLFKSASSCNIFIITSGFLIGMGGPILCSILVILATDRKNPMPHLMDIQNIITWILRLTPTFCFGKGLFNAINIEVFIHLRSMNNLTAWTEPILLYEVYFLAGQCVLYPLLAIQLDKWSTNPYTMKIWRKFLRGLTLNWTPTKKAVDVISKTADDDDVIFEQQLVVSGKHDDCRIVIKNLSKVYDDGKVAVDNLNIGIAAGECFGLLGINGAGKTTTLSLLTAEFPPSSGDAIMDGHSVAREPQKTRRLIGYCPQFDALFECLTGREHVHLYGAVKGIPSNVLSPIVERKLFEVGLNQRDWDRQSSEYSGGMKRRLSLACATIGQPSLLLLDECSTGVDPVSRREIWKMISDIVGGYGRADNNKPSVILTTHNMEECEALCPRIGIMANGKLRCLGSAQYLKNKFGNGYQVELNVMIVGTDDDDYLWVREKLLEYQQTCQIKTFDLQNCEDALKTLSENPSLSYALEANSASSAAYTVRKDALSLEGVSIDELAYFATSEIRVLNVEKFMAENFSFFEIRERQDSRVRYEVSDKQLKISSIFSNIEKNKVLLRLADYGVSQISLEQIFNMHAAEAEHRKAGRLDNELTTTCRTMESSVEITEAEHVLRVSDRRIDTKSHTQAFDVPFDESLPDYEGLILSSV